MPRTRIKFCGMTRPDDALAAAELGADAIGVVLHADTPRRVTPEQASQILGVLPPFVSPVGLFVNAPTELIVQTARALNLRHLQLHGDEPPAAVAALGGFAVIKAVRVDPDRARFAKELDRWRGVPNLAALLLETGGTTGGSGVENDWEAIRSHAAAGLFERLPRLVLAGGLRPENVADVVRALHPWAVDVSSGIESQRGVKSREKMASFVDAVRRAVRSPDTGGEG